MDLVISEQSKELVKNLTKEYEVMLKNIDDNFPEIKKTTENFYKTQTQFMDNMLTVSAPTELRNLRQILAEINKSRQAMEEAFYGTKKKKIEIKIKEKELFDEENDLKKELLQVEIDELKNQIMNTENYMKGAIRKISNYITQYNNIKKGLGKEELTEEDFEKDEERYHIMKAFEQALIAARAHGGYIDEGNHIYFHQIGINGAHAQREVSMYLQMEQKVISEGNLPAHEMTMKWLNHVANIFQGSSKDYARRKGMNIMDMDSLNTKNILTEK